METLFDRTIKELLAEMNGSTFGNRGKGFNNPGGNTQPQQPSGTSVQNPAGVGNTVQKTPMKFQNTPGQTANNQNPNQQPQMNNQVDPRVEMFTTAQAALQSNKMDDFNKIAKDWQGQDWQDWATHIQQFNK